MSLPPHLAGPPRAAPGPRPPAPRDPEAWGATTPLPVSVSQTLSGQRRNRQRRAKGPFARPIPGEFQPIPGPGESAEMSSRDCAVQE